MSIDAKNTMIAVLHKGISHLWLGLKYQPDVNNFVWVNEPVVAPPCKCEILMCNIE